MLWLLRAPHRYMWWFVGIRAWAGFVHAWGVVVHPGRGVVHRAGGCCPPLLGGVSTGCPRGARRTGVRFGWRGGSRAVRGPAAARPMPIAARPMSHSGAADVPFRRGRCPFPAIRTWAEHWASPGRRSGEFLGPRAPKQAGCERGEPRRKPGKTRDRRERWPNARWACVWPVFGAGQGWVGGPGQFPAIRTWAERWASAAGRFGWILGDAARDRARPERGMAHVGRWRSLGLARPWPSAREACVWPVSRWGLGVLASNRAGAWGCWPVPRWGLGLASNRAGACGYWPVTAPSPANPQAIPR